MGGAVWLDSEKTSPYEFYQYWRNIDDRDVEKCLGLLTFLPMDEVRHLGSLKDNEINKAKEVLAYEVTKIVHGEEEALNAQQAAKALFQGGVNVGSIPTTEMTSSEFLEGMDIITLLQKINLIPSRSEGRRLIQQNSIKVNGQNTNSIEQKITQNDFENGLLTIQKGKKVFHHVRLL